MTQNEHSLLNLIADIRAAVGDPCGRLMQDELVEHCRELAAKVERLTEECVWNYDEAHYKWDGQCGAAWFFEDGGPVENKANYCPECGRKLKQHNQ